MLLGGVTCIQGTLALARAREVQALECFHEASSADWIAHTHWYFGFIAIAEGDLANAATHFEQSLRTWLSTAVPSHSYAPLIGLADIATALGRFRVRRGYWARSKDCARRWVSHCFH
jgi:hypothetical protein